MEILCEVFEMGNIRVLLVDDERAFLDVLTKRLKRRMLEVTTATSGLEALEVLAAGKTDVVLLDVKMPGMDGIESIKAIKKAHPLVEVILLTGHADLDDSVHGMELGAFDYLLKPADTDEVVNKIEDAAARKAIAESKISVLKTLARPLDDRTASDQ